MSSKPEGKFWSTLRQKMVLGVVRLDRIENDVTFGIPDVNGCLDGEDVWIELKAPKEPARASTPLMTRSGNHALLETQINWFRRQRQAGGIAFILVRTDKRIMLVEGTLYAKVFNTWTVGEMVDHSLFVCKVPTPKQEWEMLRHVIFTASRHHRVHRSKRSHKLLDDLQR